NDTTWAEICAGSSYEFYGSEYSSTGTYSVLDVGSDCDTFRVLHLEVNEILRSDTDLVLCANDLPFEIYGITIPEGTVVTEAFDSVTFVGSNDCDSLVVINVQVLEVDFTAIDTLLCFGTVYEFEGTTISLPGVYEVVLSNAAGCDSVISLSVAYTDPPL